MKAHIVVLHGILSSKFKQTLVSLLQLRQIIQTPDPHQL